MDATPVVSDLTSNRRSDYGSGQDSPCTLGRYYLMR